MRRGLPGQKRNISDFVSHTKMLSEENHDDKTDGIDEPESASVGHRTAVEDTGNPMEEIDGAGEVKTLPCSTNDERERKCTKETVEEISRYSDGTQDGVRGDECGTEELISHKWLL